MQAWICNVLSCYKNLDQDMMNYVQAIFTYLWTIWNHRNLVIHEGKDPNPMEVILTVQNFICRFQVAFSSSSMQRRRPVQHPCAYQNLEGPWDLLIRIASIRKRKSRRVAYAYEAINLQGIAIF